MVFHKRNFTSSLLSNITGEVHLEKLMIGNKTFQKSFQRPSSERSTVAIVTNTSKHEVERSNNVVFLNIK